MEDWDDIDDVETFERIPVKKCRGPRRRTNTKQRPPSPKTMHDPSRLENLGNLLNRDRRVTKR